MNAKNRRKNRFSLSDEGLACSDGGGAIAPYSLALPWHDPFIIRNDARSRGSYKVGSAAIVSRLLP